MDNYSMIAGVKVELKEMKKIQARTRSEDNIVTISGNGTRKLVDIFNGHR
jgi:hypothetical protein